MTASDSASDRPTAPALPTPPRAEKRPVRLSLHGRERVDEYAWMRDDAWREVMQEPGKLRADVRAHLEAENAYLEAWLADTTALQDTLFEEMRGRIKEDDESVPVREGPYAYHSRHRAGGQYPIFARRRVAPDTGAPTGEEEILLDGDAEAEGRAYFDLGGVDHSPDHRLLAYAVDETGSEFYAIRVRDLATGEDLPDVIEKSAGAFVWANDSTTLFWVERDANNRPSRVRRHRLGAPAGEDPIVYEESDPGFFVSVAKTESDRFVLIDAHDHTTSEVRLIDADAPESAPRLVEPRTRDLEYDVAHRGDRLYLLTNADEAIDFKIMTAPESAPSRANWTDWIPRRDGVLVLGQHVFARHHVRLERVDGLPRLVIRRFADEAEHEIALDEEAYALGLGETLEFDTDVMRFAYASPTTPDQVFDYDMETRERRLLKTREVPSGHTPSDYVATRIQAPARDGESVPVTLVRRASTPLDGSAPVLLYGYGSYGVTIPADFRTSRLSLVDRGFIFAVAHVRGGMAKGYRWYLDGKRDKKLNTFRDFIDAGEALIARGYARRGGIVAMGGSAGGLLVGAALNMAPDLFAGAVAAVPFVDVLSTMSDAELPLTPPEWPEWGNPVEDEAAYEAIAAYSPYDNVDALAYPPILATAGLTDPRVTYWEPAKWVARLRERSTSDAPALLKVNMGAGHAGASGRWDALKETALEFAFALKVAGLADAVPPPHGGDADSGG
ncbi:MAG: S9 family peptidase [Caulobacterales bacterium]|nr:S9 family peptidase [Caulobacterales bacterium]